MAYSRRDTCLQLDRWADIMGVDPLVFNQSFVGSCAGAPVKGLCDKFWVQSSFQLSHYSTREDLGQAIHSAEESIEDHINYALCPKWFTENIPITAEQSWRLRNGHEALIRVKWDKVKSGGVRATEGVVGGAATQPSITFEDRDGDGFSEIVVIRLEDVVDFSGDVSEYQLSNSQTKTDPQNLFKAPISKEFETATGDLVLEYYSWQLLDRTIVMTPVVSNDKAGLDLCEAINYETSFWIHRIFNDEFGNNVLFRCHSHHCEDNCSGCGFCIETGCIRVVDPEIGTISVRLANVVVDEETGDKSWNSEDVCVDCTPYMAEVFYYAGCDAGGEYVDNPCFDEDIALVATARLKKGVCECGCDHDRMSELRADWSFSSRDKSYRLTVDDLRNPFGTGGGEIKAWRRLRTKKRVVTFATTIS